MIRSILLIKFQPEATEDQIELFRKEWTALPFEGRHNAEFQRDLGLTDDAMDAALIAEFDDEAAYRAWVDDPGHHRVRSEFLDPIRLRRDRFLYEI